MGRLERKLDLDLIERIEANGPQGGKKKRVPKRITPRPADTYRGWRRNHGAWTPFQAKYVAPPPVRPNKKVR